MVVSAAMLRTIVSLSAVCLCLNAKGAELLLDFNQFKINEAPPGFRSALTGQGKAGEWKVVADKARSALPPIPGQPPEYTEQWVLAQTSQERIDEHYPLLIYEKDIFDDFFLQTRFKIVAGQDEQMAGVAFRIKDEKNYYYMRASALGGTFAFFRFIDGQLSSRVSANVPIATNVWHDLTIDCKGSEIRGSLDGKELLLVIVKEQPINSGKLGFWTKSDSVALFGKTTVNYIPKVIFAQKLVNDAMERYPRVRQLKIFAARNGAPELTVIAGTNPAEIGHPAAQVEKDVIAKSSIFYGKEKDSVLVTFPLHDANGEAIAAVKVIMKSLPGQTEKNAITRALPIVKQMEERVHKASDLLQ